MAGTRGTINSGSVSTGSLSKKTILTLTASANVALIADLVSISFDGVSPTAGKILVEIERTASGGASSTNNPPVKVNASDSETLQATGARSYGTAATGTVVASELVHPQSGYTMPISAGGMKIKAGETIAINVTAPAAVNACARINFWE